MDFVNPITQFVTQRLVVGVGDMAVSNSQVATISTYALGSCIGVVAFDPVAHAGGILHLMLPTASLSPDKAKAHPCMFADTGVVAFFKALHGTGVTRKNMKILIAGGASVISQSDIFKIGERNISAIKNQFKEFNVSAQFEEVGGLSNRTVHLLIKDGTAQIKEPTGVKTFSLV